MDYLKSFQYEDKIISVGRMDGSSHCLIVVSSRNFPGGTEKNEKPKHCRCPGRDLNLSPPRYMSKALSPNQSVPFLFMSFLRCLTYDLPHREGVLPNIYIMFIVSDVNFNCARPENLIRKDITKEELYLLGYNAAWSTEIQPTFRRKCRLHLLGRRIRQA
jgi:hypothetical protein